MSERQIPTLAELSPWGQTIVMAYVESAFGAGVAEGRRQERAEVAATWANAYANSQMIARTPRYADLAEKRNEPERAERQRQILRERGIAREPVATEPDALTKLLLAARDREIAADWERVGS